MKGRIPIIVALNKVHCPSTLGAFNNWCTF